MSNTGSKPNLPAIAPSMLKCDFGDIAGEIQHLEQAGAEILHWDVMDGHFVPNLTYGPPVLERWRPLSQRVFDAHLMIADPEKFLDSYIQAGCDWITFHAEACNEPVPVLRRIRAAGRVAGIAINPETPVSAIADCQGECDLILVMSVHPGFGGQAFIPGSTEKVRDVRRVFGDDVLISIDGGIGPKNVAEVAAAGANVFVCGSSVFGQPGYQEAISHMTQLARAAS